MSAGPPPTQIRRGAPAGERAPTVRFVAGQPRRQSGAPAPSHGEDELARRHFVRIGGYVGFVFQSAFFLINLGEGVFLEATLDLATALAYLMFARRIDGARKSLVINRLIVFTVLFQSSYSMCFEHNEAAAAVAAFFTIAPVAYYLLGLAEGSLWALLSALPPALLAFAPQVFPGGSLDSAAILILLGALGVTTALSATVELLRSRSWTALLDTHQHLEAATSHLETLQGFIPVCSYCKSVMDDAGYWHNLESYLSEHTAAEVSTSVCQDCKASGEHGPSAPPLPSGDAHDVVGDVVAANEATKRLAVIWLGLLATAIVAGLALRDVLQENAASALFHCCVSVALPACAWLVWRKRHVESVYSAVLLVLTFVLVLPFLRADPHPAAVYWLLVLPIAAFYLRGAWRGLMWAVVAALLMAAVYTLPLFTDALDYSVDFRIFFSLTFVMIVIIAGNTERLRRTYARQLQQRITELRRVYDGIKTLKGLVPVCSCCKSIRTDEGFWTRMETYLASHTAARVSHGICIDCLRREMPDLYDEMVQSGEIEVDDATHSSRLRPGM